MVGTGANRTPLTKIHPVLLGQQKGASDGRQGGGSLLAHHRQQFQANQERRQQTTPSGSPQISGGPGGFGNYGQPPPPMNQYPPPPQNNYPQYNTPPPGFNSTNQQHNFNQGYPPQPQQPNFNDSYGRQKPPLPAPLTPDMSSKKKRKKSRWGDKEDKAIVSGPVTLPANMTEDQRKNYLLQFKIEEITVKLRTGELGIPADPADRSPSPEPIYNSEGKRLNTREFRVRKRLEEERHELIKQAIDEIPSYKPPVDYKPPAQKISDKVFIPAERNPAVNFIGLLIGPRGNTLKRLEKETGCKIIIRGKGSVKEGKVGRVPGQLMPGEDEPLHALITGPTEKDVKIGVKVVADIVKEGIECPDAANELRRNQLRELAELNGTLIDEEIIKCKNCGAVDHRHWECQEQKNVTNQITCHKCGGYGHVAADCRVNTDAAAPPQQTFSEKAKMDTEYMSLMAELGVDGPAPPPPKKKFQEKPPEPPKENNSSFERSNLSRDNYNDRRVDNRKRESKWGPPASSSGPKSLMDVNIGSAKSSNQNFPVNQQHRPPTAPLGQGPPWMNQQRPSNAGAPQPPGNNAPWQQSPLRGPPPQQNLPPPPTYPQQNPSANWPQLPPQSGYNQWQQPRQSYGAYNPYQQVPNQNYAAPPPPWTQQPPPPPPPPPPSS